MFVQYTVFSIAQSCVNGKPKVKHISQNIQFNVECSYETNNYVTDTAEQYTVMIQTFLGQFFSL